MHSAHAVCAGDDDDSGHDDGEDDGEEDDGDGDGGELHINERNVFVGLSVCTSQTSWILGAVSYPNC